MGLTDKIKIYADGADLETADQLIESYNVKGFTTNPTLMRKAKVVNYEEFARKILSNLKDYPISFEVFEDDIEGMRRQARLINNWGNNVYVKIPITNTEGVSMRGLIRDLNSEGIKVNTTAVFTREQIDNLEDCFDTGIPAIVSVFSGRIADAGQDPTLNIAYAVDRFREKPNVEILWASTREIYNVIQAINAGAHIITIPYSLLPKLRDIGKDLTEFSRETVIMFREDALKSGYTL